MRAYVEELKEILSNEGKLYQTLLELGKKKQEIITKGMVKELDQITQVEQSLVLQIGKEEHRREKVVEMIRKEVSLRDDITVSELIFHLDEEDQIVLEEERQKLMKILSSIKETNDLNKVLIQDSLEFIKFNLNLLTRTEETGSYGQNRGRNQATQRNNLFDIKI